MSGKTVVQCLSALVVLFAPLQACNHDMNTGEYTSFDPAFAVAIHGDYAYIGLDGGICVLNISNPLLPTKIATIETGGKAKDLFIRDSLLYMAGWYSGLFIFDITEPSSLSFIGSCDTPGRAHNVVVSGGYAYVADDWSGLLIIDITDPAEPSLIGSRDTGRAMGVAAEGEYIYVVDIYKSI